MKKQESTFDLEGDSSNDEDTKEPESTSFDLEGDSSDESDDKNPQKNKKTIQTAMATLTVVQPSLTEWFQSRKINSKSIAIIIEDLDIESPEDLAEFDDKDIEDLIASNKLESKLQNKRFMKAYREIKYDEASYNSRRSTLSSPDSLVYNSRRSTLSSPGEDTYNSRRSSLSRSSGSLVEAIYWETKDASDDGSFIVKNYRICAEDNLTPVIDAHCKVVLAETNNLVRTPFVAKISTDPSTATSLVHEMNIIKHLGKRDEDEMIISLVDWVENFDGNGNNVMIIERGRKNGDLNQLFANGHLNSIDDLSGVSIAKNLLQIGQCLQKNGIVWGDVKPGNFVSFIRMSGIHFKAIDFDSSRRDVGVGASMRGPSFLSDEFDVNDSTILVTPGYVSPERAQTIVARDTNSTIKADSRQDVFVVGLIVYQIFAKKPYFSMEEIQDESYLQTLVKKDWVADLSSVNHKDARKFLKEMLQRDPSKRKTFQQLLKHSVFSVSSSMNTSMLASQLGRMETKIDSLTALQQHLVLNSDRTMEMLEEISEHQLVLMNQLDASFTKLSLNVDKACRAIESSMQLMINLQQSDLPSLFMCVPTDLQKTKGFLSWCGALKKKTLKKTGWTKYVTMYICDEGPVLLPLQILKQEEPAHEGIDFELPGPTMIKLAPLLYVFSKLLEMASAAGSFSGIPFPSNIPGLGNMLRDAKQLKRMTKAFERVAALSDQLVEAKNMVDALESNVQEQEEQEQQQEEKQQQLGDAEDSTGTLAQVKETMQSSYFALQELLSSGKAEEQWKEFQAKGVMEKVYRKSDGR